MGLHCLLKLLLLIIHGKQRKGKFLNSKIFALRGSLVFLQAGSIFFLRGFLYHFIDEIFFRKTEAVVWRCSVKWCLKYLAKFTRKYLCWCPSLSKVAGQRPVILLKRDSDTVIFSGIFKKKFFRERASLQMFDWVLNTPYLLADVGSKS